MSKDSKEKVFTGVVKSTKADKTITIIVTASKLHPIYKKHYKTTRNFAVHDEKNEARVGDLVSIVSVRPISKTKSFKLKEIVERAPVKFEDVVEKEVEELTKKPEEPAVKESDEKKKEEDK